MSDPKAKPMTDSEIASCKILMAVATPRADVVEGLLARIDQECEMRRELQAFVTAFVSGFSSGARSGEWYIAEARDLLARAAKMEEEFNGK